MEHLSEKLSSVSEVKMEADAGSRYDKQEVMLRLAQTDSARVQNNFPVALKHMKTTMRVLVPSGSCLIIRSMSVIAPCRLSNR